MVSSPSVRAPAGLTNCVMAVAPYPAGGTLPATSRAAGATRAGSAPCSGWSESCERRDPLMGWWASARWARGPQTSMSATWRLKRLSGPLAAAGQARCCHSAKLAIALHPSPPACPFHNAGRRHGLPHHRHAAQRLCFQGRVAAALLRLLRWHKVRCAGRCRDEGVVGWGVPLPVGNQEVL